MWWHPMAKRTKKTDDGNDPVAYAQRLRRDIARLQAAKSKPQRAHYAIGSPEFEAFAHAKVIAAVKDGRLSLTPEGEIVPLVSDDEHAAPFDMKELQTIGARIAAYREAGIPMAPVPAVVSWRARALRNILEIVSGSNEAPVEFIAAATKAIDAWLDGGGQGAEPWMLVLVGIMKTHAPLENGRFLERGFGKDPTKLALAIVDSLIASSTNVPDQFANPSSENLRRAGKKVLDLRVKRKGRPGPGQCTPWTAAQEFAACLGYRMPKQSSAARKRQGGSKMRRPGHARSARKRTERVRGCPLDRVTSYP
jgi:hypothetical protein